MTSDARFQHHVWQAFTREGVTCLPAIKDDQTCFVPVLKGTDTGRYVELFGRSPKAIQAILRGAIVRFQGCEDLDVKAIFAAPSLFEGLNTLLAMRFDEPADVVLDWLDFHHKTQSANAALILSRKRPGTDNSFLTELEAGVSARPELTRVVVVEVDEPLGIAGVPASSHLSHTYAARGRNLQITAAPDPWLSPLGAITVWEALRRWALKGARAVARLDVADLVVTEAGPNIFDRATSNPGAVLPLHGRASYPWRLRNAKAAGYGDHTCVQINADEWISRWCVTPRGLTERASFRDVTVAGVRKIEGPTPSFRRCMGVRHPAVPVGKLVDKATLAEDPVLLNSLKVGFGTEPLRMPRAGGVADISDRRNVTIVTAMKNEGPFLLEWLAHHSAIGIETFLVYSNDCADGTDSMLDHLAALGLVHHRTNSYREGNLRPQHAAFRAAESEDVVRNSDWLLTLDVDEFINIHAGTGHLNDLFNAVPDANLIAMTWRLFGNSGVREYADRPVTKQFTKCAAPFTPRPYQAWGFKTLFRNDGTFRKLGVHRPRGMNVDRQNHVRWVNGSGQYLPPNMWKNGWRSSSDSYGYDLVTLNHYAVRSADSFLVKRERGRVNHVDRDQGTGYWFRMNHNMVEDRSIQRRDDATQKELAKLLADPVLANLHMESVAWHRNRIAHLKADPNYASLYVALTGAKLEKLSQNLDHFGSNVFFGGPDLIPDDIATKDPDENFTFNVKHTERQD